MSEPISSRIKNAWNAFRGKEEPKFIDRGLGYTYRPDRVRFSRGNERTIVTSIYNRIAMDVAAVNIRHVRLDDDGRYLYEIDSGLNNCLSLEANLDQTGRAFIQDVVMSMFDEGVVAILPTWTTSNPRLSDSYGILEMRTAKILEWYPESVKLYAYNDLTGKKEEVIKRKKDVAIIENPLFAVMNEPNSTVQRLINKLRLLDIVDEQNSSSKLNMIIQLPYVIKTEARRTQAENRRLEIERQLNDSKYGIAYTDGTEKITQLNRALDNSLLAQIEYLQKLVYSQLGITDTILNGTADESVMLNYQNTTVEPILSAITNELKRKFLTKTARTQFQSIKFFTDPFRLVPVAQLAELADKFTRNEIMTSNELRQIIGMKPSQDPKADELRNSNLSEPASESENEPEVSERPEEYADEAPGT